MEQLIDRAALGDPTCTSESDVLRAQAQLDWIVWSRFAGRLDRAEAEVLASDAPGLVKKIEISALPGELGAEIGWSEFTVARIAAAARRLREHTPTVWSAFAEGRVDEAKAREISSAVEKLERAASIARLDRQVVAYAESHTTGELKRWLRAFIARVEADLFNERAKDERQSRGVTILQGDNGMGQLVADLSCVSLAAIDKRLTKQAWAFGKDDPRTIDQRKADLVAAWLTTNENGQPALNADIAVMLHASTLAGADDLPVMSADGSWLVPSAWVFDLAEHAGNNLFWHRMVLDPVTDNVLAHEYRGRFAPDILAKALAFRDGVCQAPGCTKPAHLCDIDHRIPFHEGGPTAAWNLGSYDRRHPPPSTTCRGYPQPQRLRPHQHRTHREITTRPIPQHTPLQRRSTRRTQRTPTRQIHRPPPRPHLARSRLISRRGTGRPKR